MNYLTNYHTHTKRCRHARGEDREYVENAIKAGLKELGFSDHAPYVFDGNYDSGYRMFLDQAQEYKNSILSLKKEFENDIKIYYGFELEYYKDSFKREINYLKTLEPDYLILGQHFVGGEPYGTYVAYIDSDKELTRYVDECIEALSTGKFKYIAHPDIAGYKFTPSVVDREYTRLLEFCKENNYPVEINVLGIQTNRWYPNRKFFELAEKVGTKVIIGFDAHKPEAITAQSYDLAKELVEGLNLNIIDRIEI
ncbi:MAG: histidinol-phosphatase HisJ family protein [Clostridiales bacterium]|nr:histidinol-phosphatase HisJ family protein [Clostridiales bacterium]